MGRRVARGDPHAGDASAARVAATWCGPRWSGAVRRWWSTNQGWMPSDHNAAYHIGDTSHRAPAPYAAVDAVFRGSPIIQRGQCRFVGRDRESWCCEDRLRQTCPTFNRRLRRGSDSAWIGQPRSPARWGARRRSRPSSPTGSPSPTGRAPFSTNWTCDPPCLASSTHAGHQHSVTLRDLHTQASLSLRDLLHIIDVCRLWIANMRRPHSHPGTVRGGGAPGSSGPARRHPDRPVCQW